MEENGGFKGGISLSADVDLSATTRLFIRRVHQWFFNLVGHWW